MKERLLDTYGFKVPNDWLFYTLGESRVWLFTSEIADFDDSELWVETKGLYFCYVDNERLRLSPEGAQLVGLKANKNIFMLSIEQAEQIIRGFDINVITNLEAEYIILNTPKGIIGIGKNHKDKILCQIKKNRRIRINTRR